MPRVLIVTEAIRHMPGKHVDLLKAAGYEVHYPEKSVLFTEDETIAALEGFVGVIASGEPYTPRVLDALPGLRVVSRNGVGYDMIDVPAATARGVAVTITPAGNHGAVAEHAIALLLAAARAIVTSANSTRAGKWERTTPAYVPLRGSTLGIVGLGRIGRSVAIRAKAFGLRLLACDELANREFVEEHGIELVDFDTLLAQSDFVTLHAPMTAATRAMINRDTLARMKPGSILVNTARGGLVNETDLLEALQSGHLAAAGLDVLCVEPPPQDHPLLKLDNVIVTPHLAAFDTQAREDMAVGAAQNIIDLLAGRWPEGSVVNPDVKAAWQKWR